MLHLPIGQRILRYSSLDDIAIWGLLALFLVGWPVTNPARSSVLKTSVRPLAASAVIQPTNRCGRTQSVAAREQAARRDKRNRLTATDEPCEWALGPRSAAPPS